MNLQQTKTLSGQTHRYLRQNQPNQYNPISATVGGHQRLSWSMFDKEIEEKEKESLTQSKRELSPPNPTWQIFRLPCAQRR